MSAQGAATIGQIPPTKGDQEVPPTQGDQRVLPTKGNQLQPISLIEIAIRVYGGRSVNPPGYHYHTVIE